MTDLKRKKISVFSIVIFVVLVLYTLLLVALMTWGFLTSMKELNDFYLHKFGLPEQWTFSNYTEVLAKFSLKVTINGQQGLVDIWGQTGNTLLYAVGCGLSTAIACCIVSYLSAKFDFALSKIVYTIVLVAMVVPIIGSTPAYLAFMKKTQLYDTWIGVYLSNFSFLGMYFLVFHGVFSGISPEYSEAATIDGANEYQIFFKIMIPLIMPTFYTIFLIYFINFWNDYTTALLYMPDHPTLAYGVYYLSMLSSEPEMSFIPRKMAACVILALPLTLLFVAFRNKIMGNVTMGGVKE